MEKTLYRYNPWWEDDYEALEFHTREIHFNDLIKHIGDKQIIFLTGLRRIGKTSLMKLCIKYLIEEKKVKPQKCFYVSMDDYLLSGKSILEIVEEFRKINRLRNNEKVYLFLDEITFVKNYEQQLKNIYDMGNAKIFASSSSASLLRERKAHLTGRNITFEILPLNFDEYLKFKNITIKKADSHLLPVYFEDYLKTGGLPEYVLTNNDVYIRELIDNIIYKDIAAIHGIRNIQQLKDFFLLLMERSGKTLSLNKIANVLHISTDTAKRYFDLFCDTFIIYPVTRYGKLNEQMVSPKKIYACDTGIRTYYTGARDFGSLFENYVYLRVKHLKPQYIVQNTIELDFFTENKNLIECKYHNEKLSDKQQKLFDITKAKSKHIIRNNDDLKSFLERK